MRVPAEQLISEVTGSQQRREQTPSRSIQFQFRAALRRQLCHFAMQKELRRSGIHCGGLPSPSKRTLTRPTQLSAHRHILKLRCSMRIFGSLFTVARSASRPALGPV